MYVCYYHCLHSNNFGLFGVHMYLSCSHAAVLIFVHVWVAIWAYCYFVLHCVVTVLVGIIGGVLIFLALANDMGYHYYFYPPTSYSHYHCHWHHFNVILDLIHMRSVHALAPWLYDCYHHLLHVLTTDHISFLGFVYTFGTRKLRPLDLHFLASCYDAATYSCHGWLLELEGLLPIHHRHWFD